MYNKTVWYVYVCIIYIPYSFVVPTCRWMGSDDQNITDWTHHPSGGDLLESTHPQVPLQSLPASHCHVEEDQMGIIGEGKERGEEEGL